jgi:hypothetical protein
MAGSSPGSRAIHPHIPDGSDVHKVADTPRRISLSPQAFSDTMSKPRSGSGAHRSGHGSVRIVHLQRLFGRMEVCCRKLPEGRRDRRRGQYASGGPHGRTQARLVFSSPVDSHRAAARVLRVRSMAGLQAQVPCLCLYHFPFREILNPQLPRQRPLFGQYLNPNLARLVELE